MRVFDLMEGVVVQTSTLQANGYDEVVLTDEAFERFGPHVQDLVVHAESTGVSANFGFRVLLQYRYNLGAWQSDTSTLLIPATTSATYTIGPAYTDRTKLGRRIRLLLQTYVTTGGTVTQRGTLNLSVALRFFT